MANKRNKKLRSKRKNMVRLRNQIQLMNEAKISNARNAEQNLDTGTILTELEPVPQKPSKARNAEQNLDTITTLTAELEPVPSISTVSPSQNSATAATSSSQDFVMEQDAQDEHEPMKCTGRRIVDVNYIFQQIQQKARHNQLFDCGISFRLVGEKRIGLISHFKFECDMCKEIFVIQSEDTDRDDKVNLNLAATTGIIASGNGYSQFEELFSAMDISIFSPKYYAKLQEQAYEKWEEAAAESMAAAAEKEKQIAIASGHIKNGYPVIDVYVDGAWCARSYGCNFRALSGAAAIIGKETGQVLYIGVKNKFCLTCTRAKNKDVVPKTHVCFKNFEGASGSMEGEIIVEGFQSSIAMYGLIYCRMIGDGDASTYSKVLKANPYENQKVTVEKIECRNHILRGFCRKLRVLTTETKYALAHRKTLNNVKIMTMRKVIVRSIKHHKNSERPGKDSVSALHKDIVNSVSHVYGDHRMCLSHYCDKDKNDNGELKKIENSTFLFRMKAVVSNVAGKSRSLIEDVDTNRVECFNSVIAKFVGGKRVNFSSKRGYQGRCSAAVVSFNNQTTLSSIQKAIANKSPGGEVAKVEKQRAQKRKRNREHPTKKKRTLKQVNQKQHDYGPSSTAPDMTEEQLQIAKAEFMTNLIKLTADRHTIERSTILQRDCSEWLELRKNMITASNFGLVCKRKKTTSTASLVKNILYKKNLAHVASIAHGIEHEQQALQQLQTQENVHILPCGLFIDKEYPFIGATPDGLIEDDILVEVKCPITAVKKGLCQAIEDNKIQILKHNKKTNTNEINKSSNWYYQIQGQLHVTERQMCLLGIWAGETEPIFTLRIERDDIFWQTKMEPNLLQFFYTCLLPEIIDSRHSRGMPIRNLTLEGKEENLDPKLCTSELLFRPQSNLQHAATTRTVEIDAEKENCNPKLVLQRSPSHQSPSHHHHNSQPSTISPSPLTTNTRILNFTDF